MDPSKNPSGGGGARRRDVDQEEYNIQTNTADMIAQVMDQEDVDSEERFDRTLLDNSEAMLDSRRFDERDYQSHRRESFPHAHNPLRSNRSSHRRKSVKASKEPSSDAGSPNILPVSKVTPIHVPIPDAYHSRAHIASEENFEIEPLLNLNDNEPESLETPNEVLVHPECSFFDDLSMSPVKKVQFEVGGSPVPSNENIPVPEKKKHRRHHHHHHHHHHYSKMHEDMSPDVLSDADQPVRYNPLMPESLDLGPEVPMADLDKDDLTTHRFADNKSFRRHKFQKNLTQDEQSPFKQPVKYDHQPHEIFVELDVLSGHGEHRQWKEAARWIKYEEDVEEGVDRWGRPHVASLSFHSLINLRRLIESGVTLLDLEERDLPGVAYRSVEAMVVHELIRPEDRAMVMRALLLKHKHVNENDGWRFNIRRNTHSGSLTSLQAILDHDKGRKGSHPVGLTSPNTAPEGLSKMSRRNSITTPKLLQNLNESRGIANGYNPDLVANQDESAHTAVDMSKLSLSNLSEEDVKWVLNKESSLLRRIPVGAEASIVLVGKDETLKRPIMAFIRLAESSYMPNITELPIPVRFMYILLGPSTYDLDYKEIGRSISTLMSNKHFHEIAYRAHDKKDMLKGIHEFLDESIVLPPGDWDNELFPFEEMKEKSQALRKRKEKREKKASQFNGLKGLPPPTPPPDGEDPFRRTKKLFGGMIQDIRKRYPQYFSDLKDGLHFQILASILFIYFACVSGAIAFGGILGKKTGQHIGISETLITTAIGGVVFSLFAGQPLVILGTTGPLLMFDESLYSVCTKLEMEDNFLAFRFFIGIWLVLIATFFCAFDGSAIARYFSRFIQEIFAAMISILFIYDAINSLATVYIEHPLRIHYPPPDPDKRNLPNTALLSTVMCLGTFGVAYLFRQIRTSRYFNPMIRDLLGNFAVPIAIIAMVGLDLILRNAAWTQKLDVPDGLENTKQRSSWLVDLSTLPIHYYFIAAVPAMLIFILIFMEMSICSLIIAKKENKLKKGTGFFVDIFLVCVINGCLMSIGGCWVGAATVRAVAHASSLVVFSTNNPPGEKPTVLGVREQRVSNFIISILVGVSVMMGPALKLIPMSVLFGVFLYMGISSMAGIQFFERISLIFTQVSNYPQVPYVRRVRTKKLHLFTLIQLVCLAILFGVKFTPAALAIPFLLVLLVPLRFFLLPFIFTKVELGCLDAKGLEPDESPRSEEHLEIPVISVTDIKAVQLSLPETATEETNINTEADEPEKAQQEEPSNGKVEMNGTATSNPSVEEGSKSQHW